LSFTGLVILPDHKPILRNPTIVTSFRASE
jgi:hypothetical protein